MRTIEAVEHQRGEATRMKRVAYAALFFLAGILFPVLIWVGLFVAIRQPLVRAARRVGSVMLALLLGMLAPILIWVGLFVAIREPLLQTSRRFASVILALLAGVLFPVLIWVGLVVAVSQWIQEGIPQREPARTIGEILAAAGLTIQQEPLEGKLVTATVFAKQPMPEIYRLLARAGL